MKPIVFTMRRAVAATMLVAALAIGAVLGLTKMGVEIFPPPVSQKLHICLDYIGKGATQLKAFVGRFHKHEEQAHHEEHQIVVSSPKAKAVTITQPYVCQIHSQQHIPVRALEQGYLQEIAIKEGQAVKKGDLLFKVIPVIYQAEFDAEVAERDFTQLEFNNTERLFNQKVVSENQLKLLAAKLAKAKARVELASARLKFAEVRAPFDGIVDRQQQQLGALVQEGEILTNLSDNSTMWVYFNVPEAQYLEYMATLKQSKEPKIELKLANGSTFNQAGKIGAIEAKFNNETGTVPFRADFPNPERLLRHGQTGTVLLHHVLNDAVIIPQRATFEILDKRYVYVVDKDDMVHQREIAILNEMDDIYIIKKGLDVGDRMVLEGMRQVRDGEKVKYEFRQPELVMANLKNKAE